MLKARKWQLYWIVSATFLAAVGCYDLVRGDLLGGFAFIAMAPIGLSNARPRKGGAAPHNPQPAREDGGSDGARPP